MRELKAINKKSILILVVVLLALTMIGCSTQATNEPANTESTSAPDSTEQASEATPEPTEEVAKNEPFEFEISAGNYVSGVDFPSGKYDLEATSGSGNVSTEDASLNEILGIEDDGFSIPTYSNAKLEAGSILTIGGTLKVKLSSEAANVSELQPRTNELTETVELSSGNYVAGDDFLAGTYNLVAIKGTGNVMTATGDLNEILGVEEDEFSIKEFKNYTFSEGEELELSGVAVNLVPSK